MNKIEREFVTNKMNMSKVKDFFNKICTVQIKLIKNKGFPKQNVKGNLLIK